MPKINLPPEVRALITARKKCKNERDRKQPKLIENREVHKATIEAKLTGLAEGNQFVNFLKCGKEEIFRTCADCGNFQTFYYSCNRKWCPLCNWKIGQARAKHLRHWTKRITQPKHLVLTMRNFPVLTRQKIREFQKALLAIRRRDIFEKVAGGCASIEITNSGNGWHIHAHLLLDVRFIEHKDIAIQWGQLIGQERAVVFIKDVRKVDYVQEVAKYVAKGNELAEWPGEMLLQFIHAIRGIRFFATFGTLRAAAKEIKREMLAEKPAAKICDCGCSEWKFETERQALVNEIRRSKRR